MNTDFRVSVGYFEHHKTKKLIRRIGDAAPVYHLRLLAYVAVRRTNGVLRRMNAEDIEIAAGWNGEPEALVKALCEVGFIDNSDGTYSIHDWEEHNNWASEADERGDSARLSRLARVNSMAAKALREDGRTGISKDEYRTYAEGTPYVRRIYDRTTPSPSPTTYLEEESSPLTPSSLIPAQGGKDVGGLRENKKPKLDRPTKGSRPQDWAAFQSIWQVYPCKQGQEEAWCEYCRLADNNTLEQPAIIRDKIIELSTNDTRWLRGIVPSLANFLKGKRWNDEPFLQADSRASPDNPLDDIAARIRREQQAVST